MTLIDDLQSAEADIRLAARKAAVAELSGLEFENEGSDKNTHFEFRFGNGYSDADVPEAFLYVERCDGYSGIEVMLWADVDWFSDNALESDYPELTDADAPLSEFASIASESVFQELDTEHRSESPEPPNWEFHSRTGQSLVYVAEFPEPSNGWRIDGYYCEECGNVETFERHVVMKEPFVRDEDGDWHGDHSREELIRVEDVVCTECDNLC